MKEEMRKEMRKIRESIDRDSEKRHLPEKTIAPCEAPKPRRSPPEKKIPIKTAPPYEAPKSQRNPPKQNTPIMDSCEGDPWPKIGESWLPPASKEEDKR